MKIESLTLSSYKRFVQEKTFEFNDGINFIIGDNGSGKTTILQAIASLIGTATQNITSPSMLNWTGYTYELLRSGKTFPKAEAKVKFEDDEIDYTKDLYKQIDELSLGTTPGSKKNVSLRLDFEKDKVNAGSTKDFFQFRGYSYAKQLAVKKKSSFDHVGNIFVYNESRDNTTFKVFSDNAKENTIREFLISRYRFHQSIKYDNRELKDDQRDFYQELSDLYSKVFKGRKLEGSVPRSSLNDIFEPDWFYFSDGNSQYELSEMSAGERAIFPILVDFANLRINNSIIIIDEIELHLHPPLQQSFYSALPFLGKNNQFIITTHSDYIISIVDESKIIRL